MPQNMKAWGPTGWPVESMPFGCERFHFNRPAQCGAVFVLLLFATILGCSSRDAEVDDYAGVRKPGQVDLQPMNLALRSQDIDRIRPFSDNTDWTMLIGQC